MKLSWKAGLALVVGGIVLGGTLSSLAQGPEGGRRGPGGPHGGPHMMHKMVRSTAIVEGSEDGTFITMRDDAGELTAIDGDTLTIEEADGEVVEITVNDDTSYHRDGEEAELSDLEVGDRVHAHREDDVTKHVGALSAEAYAEMEANREACEDDDPDTECERPPHHGGPRGPRPAQDDAAA